jgi:hypothetical protein
MEGEILHRNVGWHSMDYVGLYPRRYVFMTTTVRTLDPMKHLFCGHLVVHPCKTEFSSGSKHLAGCWLGMPLNTKNVLPKIDGLLIDYMSSYPRR